MAVSSTYSKIAECISDNYNVKPAIGIVDLYDFGNNSASTYANVNKSLDPSNMLCRNKKSHPYSSHKLCVSNKATDVSQTPFIQDGTYVTINPAYYKTAPQATATTLNMGIRYCWIGHIRANANPSYSNVHGFKFYDYGYANMPVTEWGNNRLDLTQNSLFAINDFYLKDYVMLIYIKHYNRSTNSTGECTYQYYIDNYLTNGNYYIIGFRQVPYMCGKTQAGAWASTGDVPASEKEWTDKTTLPKRSIGSIRPWITIEHSDLGFTTDSRTVSTTNDIILGTNAIIGENSFMFNTSSFQPNS